ncbi:MAG TPA: hypothetical protein VEK56_17580, partial [Vicinamibacterales bacterium]|nr:hypothetical protein [Vicinamibacterales bacterium]
LLVVSAIAGYRLSDPRQETAAALIGLGCLAVATLLPSSVRPREIRAWRATAAMICLGVSVGALAFAAPDFTTQLRNAYKYTAMGRIYREPRPGREWDVSRAAAYKGAIDTARRLTPRLSGRHYYIWYNANDSLGMFFRSVGSFFFAWSSESVLDEQYDRINVGTADRLWAGGRARDLLILTREANVALADAPLELQWTEKFATAGTTYFAHYFSVVDARLATE